MNDKWKAALAIGRSVNIEELRDYDGPDWAAKVAEAVRRNENPYWDYMEESK